MMKLHMHILDKHKMCDVCTEPALRRTPLINADIRTYR